MHPLHYERYDAGLLLGGADQPHSRKPGEFFRGIGEEFVLVRPHVLEADAAEVIDRRAQCDGPGDVGRPRFEFVGDDVVNRLFKADRTDHVAPALIRRHGLEQRRLAVEHPHAGRAVNLVAGKGVVVAVELPDVDPDVGRGLGAVNQDRRVPAVRRFDHPPHRVDGAQHVRDMGNRDKPGPRAQQLFELFENNFAVVVDGRHAQQHSDFVAQDLPGDDVRVVLHGGDHDLVACPELFPAVTSRNQVNGLRGSPDENDLPRLAGVDQPLRFYAHVLVRLRRPLAQLVHAPMDVRTLRQIEVPLGIDHRGRLLAGRRVVKIDEGLAVDLQLQDREVSPDLFDIQRSGWPFPPGWTENSRSGGWHHVSLAFCPLASRSPSAVASRARSGSYFTRPVISLAKAPVSRLRASSSPIPRERR